MASDDAKYMEEFGPRVVGVLDRLQKAAGVGELRTRADLDILAAALWELLATTLANMPEPMRGQRVTGLSETLAADVAKKREQLGLDVLQQRRRRVQPKNLDRGQYRQAAGLVCSA